MYHFNGYSFFWIWDFFPRFQFIIYTFIDLWIDALWALWSFTIYLRSIPVISVYICTITSTYLIIVLPKCWYHRLNCLFLGVLHSKPFVLLSFQGWYFLAGHQSDLFLIWYTIQNNEWFKFKVSQILRNFLLYDTDVFWASQHKDRGGEINSFVNKRLN